MSPPKKKAAKKRTKKKAAKRTAKKTPKRASKKVVKKRSSRKKASSKTPLPKLHSYKRGKKKSKFKELLTALLLIGAIIWGAVAFFKSDPPKTAVSFPSGTDIQKEEKLNFTEKPKLVIVIDDMGNTNRHAHLLKQLKNNITYAILPNLRYSKFFTDFARNRRAEYILHQPLEAEDGTPPGPGLITGQMSKKQILTILRNNLDSVPGAQGMNNHMGSKGTKNFRIMKIILEELHAQNLFFLDSLTTPSSIALQTAQSLKIPSIQRNIFLDNEDSQPYIRGQLKKLKALANLKGYAIGIGHYRENTLVVLIEEIQKLKQLGYEFVTLKELTESVG